MSKSNEFVEVYEQIAKDARERSDWWVKWEILDEFGEWFEIDRPFIPKHGCEYRHKTPEIDQHKEFKDAIKAGKTVQFNRGAALRGTYDDDHWVDVNPRTQLWMWPVGYYRVLEDVETPYVGFASGFKAEPLNPTQWHMNEQSTSDRRERIAIAAMQGILASGGRGVGSYSSAYEHVSVAAMKYANALIKELDK